MTDRQRYKSIYWCWKAMKQRVLNPNCKAFHNYGGRGIKICDEWLSFEPFLEWALSNGWCKGLDLDRRNNNGNYSPENCRWVTRKVNDNNTRRTIYITADGQTRCAAEWAEITGIERGLIDSWYKNKGEGYASFRIKEALTEGYIPKNYSYSHKQRVRNLETGEVFDSINEAAKAYNIKSAGFLSRRISTGKPTNHGKYHWQKCMEEVSNG